MPTPFPREVQALLRLCAAQKAPVYLVGGAVRDALLGRPLLDLDIATATARATARRIAAALKATCVTLDAENQVFRIPAGDGRQIDVAKLQGSLSEDLQRRDFDLNAAAWPLLEGGRLGELVDPRDARGAAARRTISAPGPEVLREDPLRLLRAFRLAAQLGFSIESRTLAWIRAERGRAARPAGERIQTELVLLASQPGCSAQLQAMDDCRVLTSLIPELEPARRCAVEYYGKGGVMLHSLDTVRRMDYLLGNLRESLPRLGGTIAEGLSADGRALLVLSALLHDVAKPPTAKKIEGRLRFFGHDLKGASMAEKILGRLRFSRAHIQTASAVIANHLRPGNLAAGGAVTDRAAYRYFRDLGRHAVDALLVCWADHASYLPEEEVRRRAREISQDPNRSDLSALPEDVRKTVRHLQVVTALLRKHFEQKAASPKLLVTGHDVMKTLGLPPGPQVGKELEAIREQQAIGRLRTRAQALSFLGRRPKPAKKHLRNRFP